MKSSYYAGSVIWLTGLSGSGKSTIARALFDSAQKWNVRAIVLDGDELRKGLNADLGYTVDDRTENLRRIAHVARLFQDQHFLVIVATISPQRQHRETAREIIGEAFLEVFVDTPLELCAQRDPKGLYARAFRGEIPGFTGVTAPYEIPDNPELVLRTEDLTVEQGVDAIAALLFPHSNARGALVSG
jgi:adenylylsulfate kinase